jgi:hypothetical protein
MERGNVGMADMSTAGETGLEVEVDKLWLFT